MSARNLLVRFIVAFAGAAAFASSAHASFHTWRIEQIFSNADGTIQFVVLHEAAGANGQNFWAGLPFTSTRAGVTNSLQFDRNLPSGATAGRRALLATKGFKDLGLVVPDYEIADGFLPVNGGALNFAGVDFVNYSSLPTDGVTAINRSGAPIPNVATNFAGHTGSVTVQAPPPAKNFQGLWWKSPAGSESGWGINFAHQGTTLFATWFTYGADGKPLWFIVLANQTAPNAFSGPVSTVTGPPFNAVPFDPALVAETVVGSASITFAADGGSATFAYTVKDVMQTKEIIRQEFASPVPGCTWGAQPNLSLATNFQDLWWAAPPGSESGWGINFAHQGDVIFATWFTYDPAGKPLWFIVLANKSAPGVYHGAVSTVTGPPFDSVPFDPAVVVETVVGDATLTFLDGNHAVFAYTVTLGGSTTQQSKSITRQVFTDPGTVCK